MVSMTNIIEQQIELVGFPQQVQVSAVPDGAGYLLRVLQDGHGAELLVTPEAIKIYGEGPSVFTGLTRLKDVTEKGLPPLLPDGSCERLIFQGD